MTNTKTRITLLTFLVSISLTIAILIYSKMPQWLSFADIFQNKQALRLEIPNANWELYFFKNLEKRTKNIDLSSLRTVVLPHNDLEVRFWFDSLEGIRCLILRRSSGKWSATFLRENYEQQSSSIEAITLGPPISGWEALWAKLISKGVLTLPDSSSNNDCKNTVIDGMTYIIETNVNHEYRTYYYGNPQYAKCDEAKQVVSIEELIASEFEFEKIWLGAAAKAAVKAAKEEYKYWEMVDKTNLNELNTYLEKYPSKWHTYLAKAIIRNIEAAKSIKVISNTNSKNHNARIAKPDPTVDKKMTGEFVMIPAGNFMMGSNLTSSYGDDKPVHEVVISKSFEMGKCEVTQEQWEAVMGSNPSYFKGDKHLPVENVSWEDVQQFINALNSKSTKYLYRLPTEAEWEYACRAGTTGDYAGNLDAIAWYANNSGDKVLNMVMGDFYTEKTQANVCRTHAVGQKKPNAWGLYDMHGNVSEWCSDWHWEYSSERVADPKGNSSGWNRVKRGGSYFDTADRCQSASRGYNSPTSNSDSIGFRLVRTVRFLP